ncbi:unnamed protein product, partial [Allacma fusca]
MKNLVIFGAPEDIQEPFKKLEQNVENIFSELELPGVNIDTVRRIGRKFIGKSRPISVTLAYAREKVAILTAKFTHKDKPTLKGIYINAEKTPREIKVQRKLAEKARELKLIDPLVKMKIRFEKMYITHASGAQVTSVLGT